MQMFKHYSHKELIASIIRHNNEIGIQNFDISLTKYKKIVDKIEANYTIIRIGDEPQYDGETTNVSDSVVQLSVCYIKGKHIRCDKKFMNKIPSRYVSSELLRILNSLYDGIIP